MKKMLIITIIGFTLYSCSKKITPTATVINSNTKTEESTSEKTTAKIESTMPAIEAKASEKMDAIKNDKMIKDGLLTYKIKCSKCHELHDTEEFTATKWVKIIDWMAPKARLEPEEKANVLAYVSAYAKK